MLDHRRGDWKICRIGPTLAQEMPAPSGVSLGMHCSMVIAMGAKGQRVAVNGEERPLRGVERKVNRDGRASAELRAWLSGRG